MAIGVLPFLPMPTQEQVAARTKKILRSLDTGCRIAVRFHALVFPMGHTKAVGGPQVPMDMREQQRARRIVIVKHH